MIHSRITSKSQTTVPLAVRRALGVKPGDTLSYAIENGRVLLTRADATVPADPFIANFSTFTEWATEADEKAYADL
ncbi:type II toxin-antitoxin system PrlF family antitoxin [Sphingomonas sp.]|uniref:type II toxin-antitoxin system PrlF family antitoxin n=1 Tax=Sphingomonas sp. TaxID=28214 RepID=UPI0035BC074F